MIDVEGLAKTYAGGREGAARALDEVTFRVPDRSIFGFLGPNGAGKTTTIRILATILEPTEGRAASAGHDVRAEPFVVKAAIGYMPASLGFHPTVNAAQHLGYWGRFYWMPRADRPRRVQELLELLGHDRHRDKQVKAYGREPPWPRSSCGSRSCSAFRSSCASTRSCDVRNGLRAFICVQ